MRTLFLFLLTFFIYFKGQSSPYPVTGSSVLLDNKLNIFLWPYHFNLDLRRSSYHLDLNQENASKWSIQGSDPDIQIYLRFHLLKPQESYSKVLKNWIREYEKSGFQLVSQNIHTSNATKGWIHLQDSHSRQLLQFFKYQNKTWVYLNCIGPQKKISQLRQTCEFLSTRLQFLP